MIILFSLLSIINIVISCPINLFNQNNNKLINNDIIAQIKNNELQINNNNIKYSYFKYGNIYNKINSNDNITFGKDYSISYIRSDIKTDNLNINFLYEITSNNTAFVNDMKKVVKYEENKLYVSMFIHNKNLDYKYLHDDLEFSFNIDTMTDFYNSSIVFDNLIIKFNEYCINDGYDSQVIISKSVNNYKIYFPSFYKNLYYDFIISKNY